MHASRLLTGTHKQTLAPARDGIMVMYDANTTMPSMPPGFGYTASSQMNCVSGSMNCVEGVMPMLVPAGPGLSIVSYVFTSNKTRTDAGAQRNEWFIMQVGPCIVLGRWYSRCKPTMYPLTGIGTETVEGE